MTAEEQLEKRMQEWRTLSARRADAKANMVYLEHYRKAKRAELETQAPEGSEASKQRWALRHPDYEKVIAGYSDAVRAFEKLDWEMRIAMRKSEIWQSMQANRRAERSQYND